MCGIVGAVSTRNIVPILVQGLQRLEYRGYDSCGVAVHAVDASGPGTRLQRLRGIARVADLAAQAESQPLAGHTGIAHTRWATRAMPRRRCRRVPGPDASTACTATPHEP